MLQHLGPIQQVLINEFKCLLIVSRQLNSLPQVLWRVSSLYSLHIQIKHSIVVTDGGIANVGKGTRASTADTSYIIRVSAEDSGFDFGHITAVYVSDIVPYSLIVLHLSQ